MQACTNLRAVITQLAAKCKTALDTLRRWMQLSKRIPGCQSTNHTECYGELWECVNCGKKVCFAEGTDLDPDLCDDCWTQQHKD